MGTATDNCGVGESKLSKEILTFETSKFVNMKPPERENSNGENDKCGLGESKLSKEMLTFETPKFVNIKPPERGSPNEENHSQMIALGDETRNTGQLRVMELSNVDQMYDYYMRIALFYDVCKSKHGVPGCKDLLNAIDSAENGPVRRLEAALEELLLHYPAAAGQVCYNEHKARLEIHYYDGLPTTAVGTTGDDGDDGWRGGVRFITAHANIALKELGDPSVPNPSLDLLYPNPTFGARLPGQNGNVSERYLTRPVTVIQVTTFTCGGFCLAHLSHHTLLDGDGGAAFLQNLCSIARGAGVTVCPDFSISRREIFKPRVPPSPSLDVMRISSIRFLPNGQLVEAQGFPQERLPAGTASSFLFPYAVLERLREKASHSLTDKGKQCSRYQALVGLLWKARARSLLAMAGNSLTQEFNLRFPVNLRDRGIPGLDRHYSGNSVFQLAIRGTLQELCENPLEKLVKKLQSVMKSIDFPECAQSLTDYIELKMQEGLTPDIDRPCLAVVALFGLPFYDTDCGWGRPIFCGLPSRQLATRVTILDHPTAAAWNVLTVLNSQEEYTAFVQQIEEYTLS